MLASIRQKDPTHAVPFPTNHYKFALDLPPVVENYKELFYIILGELSNIRGK